MNIFNGKVIQLIQSEHSNRKQNVLQHSLVSLVHQMKAVFEIHLLFYLFNLLFITIFFFSVVVIHLKDS